MNVYFFFVDIFCKIVILILTNSILLVSDLAMSSMTDAVWQQLVVIDGSNRQETKAAFDYCQYAANELIKIFVKLQDFWDNT